MQSAGWKQSVTLFPEPRDTKMIAIAYNKNAFAESFAYFKIALVDYDVLKMVNI